MTLLKILGPNRESIHGGHWTWEPGEWTPETHPVVCVTGWHLVRPWDLGRWWDLDCTVWEAEGRGLYADAAPKTAFAQARILRQLHTPTLPELVGWAADCAERALPHVPPGEQRPAAAIAVAKAWAACPCSRHAKAAYAAAHAANAAAYAANAAAYAAAYAANAAAYAAYTANAANNAANAEAYNAAANNAAAYAAANAAAYAAAYAAQAASYAVAYAAEAAQAASYAVAYAAEAAQAAANNAAEAAEHTWQDGHMMALLEPK